MLHLKKKIHPGYGIKERKDNEMATRMALGKTTLNAGNLLAWLCAASLSAAAAGCSSTESAADAARMATVKEFSGEAIQRAIDALAEKGGGKVVVPAGSYPITYIRLRSGIELHLEKGATLMGPTDPNMCRQFPSGKNITNVTIGMGSGLIQAWNERNIAITGEGAIDAQGVTYFDTSDTSLAGRFFHPYEGNRPKILILCRCTNVTMRGVSFLNSPSWTMRVRFCENVEIDGIKVLNDLRFINGDGIDIDASRHVRMRNSRFLTGDDSVVLRAVREPNSSEPAITEDVLVENCELESACQTVRVGGPSDDTIRNATFRNIRAKGYNGIRFDYPPRYLLNGDEGSLDVHDITFENYSGEFTACALQITVGSGVKLRGVRDILFKDFNVKSAKPLQFKGNIHTKLERIRRVNFTFNGSVLPDGEFEADCTDARPLKREPRKSPKFYRQRPAALR